MIVGGNGKELSISLDHEFLSLVIEDPLTGRVMTYTGTRSQVQRELENVLKQDNRITAGLTSAK